MSWPNRRGDDSLRVDYRDAGLIEGAHAHLPVPPSTIYLSSFHTHPKQSGVSLDFASATAYLPAKPSPNDWPHNAIDPALVDPQHPSSLWGYPIAPEFTHFSPNPAPMSLGHGRSASNQTMSPSVPSTRACSNEAFKATRSMQGAQYAP